MTRYNPENARFQIADEITYLGITGTVNSYNLFSYCENEPINHMDEDGHEGFALVAVGGLILAVAFLVSYFAVLSNNRSRGNYGGTYWNNDWLKQIEEGFKKFVQMIKTMIISVVLSVMLKKVREYNTIEVHHIIAKRSIKALLARYIYVNECKLDIENVRNKIAIKKGYHKVLHTNDYFFVINAAISIAYIEDGKKGVIEVLALIKSYLSILGGSKSV